MRIYELKSNPLSRALPSHSFHALVAFAATNARCLSNLVAASPARAGKLSAAAQRYGLYQRLQKLDNLWLVSGILRQPLVADATNVGPAIARIHNHLQSIAVRSRQATSPRCVSASVVEQKLPLKPRGNALRVCGGFSMPTTSLVSISALLAHLAKEQSRPTTACRTLPARTVLLAWSTTCLKPSYSGGCGRGPYARVTGISLGCGSANARKACSPRCNTTATRNAAHVAGLQRRSNQHHEPSFPQQQSQ